MFKLEDTVEIIENNSSSFNLIGDVGIIKELNANGFARVFCENGEQSKNWHKYSDLKLISKVIINIIEW